MSATGQRAPGGPGITSSRSPGSLGEAEVEVVATAAMPAPGRLATRIHLLTIGGGFLLLAVFNRRQWFFADDWEFIVNRGLHRAARGLWTPHNEHWSTLPILAFRATFALFGVRTVWPLLLLMLGLHVASAHLLWRLGLRSGANPWMMTALTAIFLFLAPAAGSVTWDFQITYNGSVFFGCLAVTASLHDGGSRGRNLLMVWVAAVAALMCSGIGLTMLAALVLITLLRQGWPAAAAVGSVPAGIYVVWYAAAGHTGTANDHIGPTAALAAPHYVWNGLSDALGATVGLSEAGPALLLLLLGWTLSRGVTHVASYAPALGLGGSSFALFGLIGLTRTSLGISDVGAPRYTYVAIALLLPLAGVALTGVARSRQLPMIALVSVLAATNLGDLRTAAAQQGALARQVEHKILAAAQVLTSGDTALVARPEPLYSPDITDSSLVAMKRRGQLPHLAVTPTDILTQQAIIDVGLTAAPVGTRPTTLSGPGTRGLGSSSDCVTEPAGRTSSLRFLVPRGGASLRVAAPFAQTVAVTLDAGALAPSGPTNLSLVPGAPAWVSVTAAGDLAAVTLAGAGSTQVCLPRS